MQPAPWLGVGGIAGVIALAACGGKPAPDTGPRVSSVPLTRVQVEDEPDDGVQVISTKGHVEPAVVEAAIAPHRDALTACYLERIGKRRWLGGQLVLRWVVAADGTVDKVLLAENDLGAWSVEKCVLDLARATSFGAPIGGAAEVTLPLTFSAPRTPGLWDADESATAVGAQLAELDACALGKPAVPDRSVRAGKAGKAGKRAKASKPDKASKAAKASKPDKASKADKASTAAMPAMPDDVVITIYVGPRGHAQSVGFASAVSVLEDAWAACAEQAVLAWHLPDPKGQVTKLAVRYRPR